MIMGLVDAHAQGKSLTPTFGTIMKWSSVSVAIAIGVGFIVFLIVACCVEWKRGRRAAKEDIEADCV